LALNGHVRACGEEVRRARPGLASGCTARELVFKSVPGSIRNRNPLIRVKDHETGISKPRWVGGFAGMVPWQS
jgi:hypothetical protein